MTTFTPPNCPKCDGPAIAPTRQGMSIPFKCTKCEHVFGMSLLYQKIGLTDAEFSDLKVKP